MIPAKYSGRGSGACAEGGVHPIYCSKCGKIVKTIKGKKYNYGGLVMVQAGTSICGKCRAK